MSLHCTYNTNHWPCNYCTASDPKDKNAECNFARKETEMPNNEKVFDMGVMRCPLCSEKVAISVHENRREISCKNPNCLAPSSGWGAWEEVLAKWKKYCD